MTENETAVIRELCDSYRLQLGFYNALGETVHRILSRLILSRGDLSALKTDFAEKQQYLRQIESERLKTAHQVKLWQEIKSHREGTKEALELDGVLRETEATIKKFLDGEDQLKKHLERLMRKKA